MMTSDTLYTAFSPPESLLATLDESDPYHNYPTPPPEKERQKSQLENARSLFLRALPGEREKPVAEEPENPGNAYVYQPTDPDLVRSWLAPYGIVLEGCDCCKFQLREHNCQGADEMEADDYEEEICGSRMKVGRKKTRKRVIEEDEDHPETIQEQIARGAKTQADPKEIDEFVTRIMKQAEIIADMEGPPPKKPRGRPKGAKSKPKIRVAPEIEIVKTVPAPRRNPQDRKGCVPYGIIAGLAILNAKKAIPSKEIYRFAKHYFPGCVVGTYWKNSIRHILCTQDYFIKDRPDVGTAYSFHWDIVPEKMHRFWSSVEEFRRTYPTEEAYGMTDPSQWPRLIKGELGLLPADVQVDLRDYPKNINIKSEPIDMDYCDSTENSQDVPVEEAPREKTIRVKQEPEECPAIAEILNKPSVSRPPSASNDPQSISLFSSDSWGQSTSPDACPPPAPFASTSHPPTPRFPPQFHSSPPLGQSHFAPPPFPSPYYRSPPPGQQHSPPFMPPPHGMWPHPPYRMPGYPPGQVPPQYYPHPGFNPATNSTPNMPVDQWHPGQRLSPKDIEEESKSILLELLTSDSNKENDAPTEEESPVIVVSQMETKPKISELRETNNGEGMWYQGEATPSGSAEAPSTSHPGPSVPDSEIPVENTCPTEETPTEQKIPEEQTSREIPWHLYDHDYCRNSTLPYPPSKWLENR